MIDHATALPIEAVKAMQAAAGRRDTHLVHVAVPGFTIAHTDIERAGAAPLDECELHRWMVAEGWAPVAFGLYWVTPQEGDPVAPFLFEDFVAPGDQDAPA